MTRILFGVMLLASVGCGGDSLLAQGKPCKSSVECAAGLLCDYGQKPPACSPMDTVGRDMAKAPPDLSMFDMPPPTDDMAVVVTDDMTGVVMDMTMPPQPDMTQPPVIDMTQSD